MSRPADRPATRPRVVAGLRLVRLVGHGGEGEVWEARTSRGEPRALKLIRPDALVEPEEVERRGRWLRAVDHPALVAVRRTGVLAGGGLDGWAFVEMPFLDGPSLENAPADDEALERLRPLAEALDALHAGVWSDGVPLVHRDVKPANLIAVDGRVVLVDHSTLRDASAQTVTRIGTPVFAAPEVPLGRAGPPADVYAFAATAVALLTGARGRTLAALLDDPGSLDVPDGLRAALAADPRERARSCRAALDAPAPALRSPDGPEVSAGARDPRVADAGGFGDALPTVVGPWPAPVDVRPAPVDVRPAPDDVPPAPGAVRPAPDDVPPAPGAVRPAPVDVRPAPDNVRPAPDDVPPAPGAVRPALDDVPPVPAPTAPAPVWRWVLALAVVTLVPPAVLAAGRPLWPDLAAAVGAAALLHLVAHAVAGGPGVLRVLVPPLAWAWLLAARASPMPRRQAYARAVLAGALTAGAAGALWALVDEGPDVVLLVVTLSLGFTTAGVTAARHGGLALQLLLLPLWVAGAALLVVGGIALSPLGALVGRGRACVRLVGETLAGSVEALRRPVAPPGTLP